MATPTDAQVPLHVELPRDRAGFGDRFEGSADQDDGVVGGANAIGFVVVGDGRAPVPGLAKRTSSSPGLKSEKSVLYQTISWITGGDFSKFYLEKSIPKIEFSR